MQRSLFRPGDQAESLSQNNYRAAERVSGDLMKTNPYYGRKCVICADRDLFGEFFF